MSDLTYFTIPTSSSQTWYTEQVSLSGVTYTLEFRYNSRMDRWILNINDAASNPILVGIALLIERNLTGQYTALALPPGAIIATDDSGNDTQPTLTSFLVDHTLRYATAT